MQKFNDNLAAIRTLKQLEAEQRRASPDEQAVLARYVGWGGLANAFPERMPHLGAGSQHLGNFGKVVVRGLTGTLAFNPIPQARGAAAGEDVQADHELARRQALIGHAGEDEAVRDGVLALGLQLLEGAVRLAGFADDGLALLELFDAHAAHGLDRLQDVHGLAGGVVHH